MTNASKKQNIILIATLAVVFAALVTLAALTSSANRRAKAAADARSPLPENRIGEQVDESAALDDGLADVGGGEAAVRIGTVGAHEAFGEVVGAEFFAGGAADDGFGGGADLTADEVDAEAASGQLESVGDGVGDIDGTVLGDEGDHGGGGGAAGGAVVLLRDRAQSGRA